jgi:hypothetical protein
MTSHITDERLRGYIQGSVELARNEQEHMLNCESCNERFRTFLTSNADPQEAKTEGEPKRSKRSAGRK